MIKLNNILVSLLAAIILCAPVSYTHANDTQKPNILLIMADDLGYADVGFNGSKDIITPNIDDLANKGTSFSEAYVAHPFCGPSRAGLLTGRYPHKIGAQFNLPTRGSHLGVPTSEMFMSKFLQNNGYFTGAIGKWHLGDAPQYHPNQRGFDEYYGFLGGGHNYFPEQFAAAYKRQKEQGLSNIFEYITPLEHNGKEVTETEYITDALSREAVTFVNKAVSKTQPFFLYLAYNAPHVPLEAKQEDMDMFPNIKDKKRKTYAGMVYALDRGVGRVVDALKKNGQLDNTLIVFLSDNGGKLSQGANNDPLKAGKGSAQEGGFRVPMFFHWPNHVPSGQRFEHPVSSLDFYPTFAALAGAEVPADKQLDGKNMWEAFKANKNPHQDDLIFLLRHRGGYSDAAVRRNQYKALKIADKPWRLFDIDNDIEENHDISAQHPLILKDMVREMEKWSWDNQQPLWFHEHYEGAHWRLNAMPRFEQTFKTDQ
ncbi:sulfatase-like hydrolase/transferase [Pseudoalteromonas sp. S1727]|uniref:sulfatase family protein n=1 Tax=Pseudoalteromonas sp. S1727 TaxID=2066514 RepID=UPI001486AC09|nr:sulfatase-like hydrolase/transferase [Pseudoalteromonas sp. S1727]